MRQVESLRSGNKNRYAAKNDKAWQLHIEGALGEMAAAKVLGVYWSSSVNGFKHPDVGAWQVRTRSSHDYDLIVRDSDAPGSRYVLVTGSMGLYRVHGWVYGHEARRKEWRKNHGQHGVAWFVPQAALRPVDEMVNAPS